MKFPFRSLGAAGPAVTFLREICNLAVPHPLRHFLYKLAGLHQLVNAPTQHHLSKLSGDRTILAIQFQLTAMAADLFEIGLFNPDPGPKEAVMIPRVWGAETILKSMPWLRLQNRDGRNIYVRPKGEHHLSLVDDLTKDALSLMKAGGFNPALVVETSPNNFQAWLKHSERLSKEVGTAAARALAEKFGGDRGAADWRHFGRLAGFTNRKAKYLDARTGLYPFVRLIEAEGRVYAEADRFLAGVKNDVARQNADRERVREQVAKIPPTLPKNLKSIEAFRADSRYAADGTRIDLAYAVYAFAHGATPTEVAAALRSRDLTHKGNERRQNDYVERTIKKALSTVERGR